MNEHEYFIEPLRLIEAADAVAEALAEVADASTGRCPYPPAMLGMPSSGHVKPTENPNRVV